jgi:hypothetical protein
MISELDRYHGVVLRQLLVTHGRQLRMGVADIAGRVDAFSLEGAAFQIKHSTKRLSPWQFTYAPENLGELTDLCVNYRPVWTFFVCGVDGVVGLSFEEVMSIVTIGPGGAGSLRISRDRKSMYRVSGSGGELARAKPRGVQTFLAAVLANDKAAAPS